MDVGKRKWKLCLFSTKGTSRRRGPTFLGPTAGPMVCHKISNTNSQNLFQDTEDAQNPFQHPPSPSQPVSGPRGPDTYYYDATEFCARCAAIDFGSIFSTNFESKFGTTIDSKSLYNIAGESHRARAICKLAEHRVELETSSCPLCQLFLSIAPEQVQGWYNQPESIWLDAVSARWAYLGDGTESYVENDVTLVGVGILRFLYENPYNNLCSGFGGDVRGGKGFLFSDQILYNDVNFAFHSVNPQRFDVAFARHCISYCLGNHGISCNDPGGGANKIQSLKVIDCKRQRVVAAPSDCSYAALSYVWGEEAGPSIQTGGPNTSESGGPLDGCPAIISDGMKATLRIGLRYLWADKYCINQNDPGDKHKQIRQMDKIYANAKVTIIAATSVLVDGLPGVGRIERPSQACLQLGGLILGRTLREPHWIVGASKWSTRGWTFQEGLLSRRRLIFTDEQVIFECNGMHCVESRTLPLDKMHDRETNRFKSTLPSGSFRRKTLGSDLEDFMTYVSEFSERELRFLDDRLNAMRGIFHRFETAPFPVHQLMGVPVFPPWVYHYRERDKPKVFARVNRTPEQGFLVGLTWSHGSNSATGTRIPQFPSWSWAGWTRRVDYTLKFDDWWTTTLNETRVWMEGDSGELREFPTLDQLRDLKPNDPLGRQMFIVIEGNTFACSTVQLKREDLPEPQRFGVDAKPGTPRYVQVAGENGWSYYFSVSWDRSLETNEQSGKRLTGILIGDLDNDPRDYIAIIFVEELNGHAQRIAVGDDSSAIYKGWKADKTAGMSYRWLDFDDEKHKNWKRVKMKRRIIRLG